MIEHTFDRADSILYVRLKDSLKQGDFAELAKTVDPYIEQTGDLAGIIIEAPTFPGWESLGATRATGLKEIDKYRDVAQQIQQRVHLLCAFPIEKLGHLAPEQRATS